MCACCQVLNRPGDWVVEAARLAAQREEHAAKLAAAQAAARVVSVLGSALSLCGLCMCRTTHCLQGMLHTKHAVGDMPDVLPGLPPEPCCMVMPDVMALCWLVLCGATSPPQHANAFLPIVLQFLIMYASRHPLYMQAGAGALPAADAQQQQQQQGSGDQNQTPLSAFEIERQQNIQRNRERLQELLPEAAPPALAPAPDTAAAAAAAAGGGSPASPVTPGGVTAPGRPPLPPSSSRGAAAGAASMAQPVEGNGFLGLGSHPGTEAFRGPRASSSSSKGGNKGGSKGSGKKSHGGGKGRGPAVPSMAKVGQMAQEAVAGRFNMAGTGAEGTVNPGQRPPRKAAVQAAVKIKLDATATPNTMLDPRMVHAAAAHVATSTLQGAGTDLVPAAAPEAPLPVMPAAAAPHAAGAAAELLPGEAAAAAAAAGAAGASNTADVQLQQQASPKKSPAGRKTARSAGTKRGRAALNPEPAEAAAAEEAACEAPATPAAAAAAAGASKGGARAKLSAAMAAGKALMASGFEAITGTPVSKMPRTQHSRRANPHPALEGDAE